jgi:formylglycine-generating enzyme required for sulfatase activity
LARRRREASGRERNGPRQRYARLAVIVAAAIVVAIAVKALTRREPAGAAPAAAPAMAAPVAFEPTVVDTTALPGPPPAGMVWIPNGEFSMGAQDEPGAGEVGMRATDDSRPIHRVRVRGFWMDATVVTNDEFARFVEAPGYLTVA